MPYFTQAIENSAWINTYDIITWVCCWTRRMYRIFVIHVAFGVRVSEWRVRKCAYKRKKRKAKILLNIIRVPCKNDNGLSFVDDVLFYLYFESEMTISPPPMYYITGWFRDDSGMIRTLARAQLTWTRAKSNLSSDNRKVSREGFLSIPLNAFALSR